MKKILLLSLLGLFFVGPAMAQLSTENPVFEEIQLEEITLGLDDQKSGTCLIVLEEEDDMYRRRRRRGRRGRGGGNAIAFGPQVDIAIPLGDLNNVASIGTGFSINAKLMMNQLAFGINFNYYHFGPDLSGFLSDTSSTPDVSTNIMPILLTAEYFFMTDMFRPYAGLGLGFYSLTSKSTFGEVLGGDDLKVTKGCFGMAPSGGFLLAFGDMFAVDFNIRYNMFFDKRDVIEDGDIYEQTFMNSFLAINVGCLFMFGM